MAPDHLFVLGIDLFKSYMQHAILILEYQGLLSPIDQPPDEDLFENFEIYIGDNEDW